VPLPAKDFASQRPPTTEQRNVRELEMRITVILAMFVLVFGTGCRFTA